MQTRSFAQSPQDAKVAYFPRKHEEIRERKALLKLAVFVVELCASVKQKTSWKDVQPHPFELRRQLNTGNMTLFWRFRVWNKALKLYKVRQIHVTVTLCRSSSWGETLTAGNRSQLSHGSTGKRSWRLKMQFLVFFSLLLLCLPAVHDCFAMLGLRIIALPADFRASMSVLLRCRESLKFAAEPWGEMLLTRLLMGRMDLCCLPVLSETPLFTSSTHVSELSRGVMLHLGQMGHDRHHYGLSGCFLIRTVFFIIVYRVLGLCCPILCLERSKPKSPQHLNCFFIHFSDNLSKSLLYFITRECSIVVEMWHFNDISL